MASESALEAELFVPGPLRPRLSLSLSLGEGVTTLVGPSGSGKSTCLFALAGLVRPARGRIVLRGRTLFDGDRAVDVPARARGVALVFQTLALFPHLTVAQNVAFAVPRATPAAQRRAIVAEWLERMHVQPLATRLPGTLSGGEAQRVALARALASAPALLLLDEPFSALDEALREQLAGEVARVVAELRIPALLVTHDTHDARAVISLREGCREEPAQQPVHVPGVPR